jgi:hypothetical protein
MDLHQILLETQQDSFGNTECLKQHLVIIPHAKRKPTNGLSIARMDGRHAKVKAKVKVKVTL